MKVEIGENGYLELGDVFNPLTLRTGDERFIISMRDSAFELTYSGVHYTAKGGVIKALRGCKIQNFSAEEPVDRAVDQDLIATKRNVEIAADFQDLTGGRGLDLRRLLVQVLAHRKEVAQRLLATVRSKNPQQVEELHNLFEYDQSQLRQLLGMTLPGD